MSIQPVVAFRPALCLDLDDTIRYARNGGFINKPDDIALFDDVEEKLWEYRDKGYLILGVSNQGGIAYGIKTMEQDLAEIEATMRLFKKSPFDMVRSCPFHPQGRIFPFNTRSLMRKPDIGMLVALEAAMLVEANTMIDWENSLFVGDRTEDKECARNARIAFQWAWDFFGRGRPE